MGQHHQILVIAKVGHRYRVLAAVHHRWCYGTIENINNCWRFLKMMENPENQRLARHEITAAARHDANWWTKLEEMVDADWWTKEKRMVEETHDITEQMPFPFLMTCLVLAAGFEPRVHPTISCISRVAPTDMGTSSSESENRDGFTIIDITALDKPTYCFTQWDENLHGATGRGGCDTPITGEEYLRYPDSRRAYCSSLAAWDVVDDGVLGDLWPGEGWKDREGTRSSTAAETKLDGSLQGNTTSSLSDLACQRAVEAALDDADMEEALTSVENIPSIPGRFARYMLDNPASAGRPCGARLLVRALKGGLGGENGGYLDLSHWPLLTDDDVLHVVKHGTSVNDITGIDLSNNHNVSAKCFRSLVDLCPSLTRLVSISTPSTSLSDLLGCLDISKKAYEISHSDHFRAAFGTIQGVKDLSDCPYFGALNTVTQVFYYCEPSVARPQAQLVQTGGENNDSGLDWRGGITRLKWLYNGLDAHGFNQPIVRAIPLQDAMLAPYRIADWFPQVFQMAIHHKHSHRRNKANGVCPDFAMALAVGLKDAWRVKPLPALPYNMCWGRGSENIVPKCGPVEKGSWTMLVFASVDAKASPEGQGMIEEVHYALLTRDQDGGLIVAGLEDFVERTVGGDADMALKELISNVTSPQGTEGEDGVGTRIPVETDMISIDWAKLKLFHEEEAKDIVESFFPAYEEARKAGIRSRGGSAS